MKTEFVYKDYQVRVLPHLMKALRPTPHFLNEVIDDCFSVRRERGFTQMSMHPVLMGVDNWKAGDGETATAMWKVGIAILPVEKTVYIGFPEEHPPGVTFDFPPLPGFETVH